MLTSALRLFRSHYEILSYSFLLTMARGVALTYAVLYLHGHFNLSIEAIGLVVGLAAISGATISILGGVYLDSQNKLFVLFISSLGSAIAYLIVPLVDAIAVVTVLLMLINMAYSVAAVAIKALMSETCERNQSQELLALRYTLTNIAFGLGPLLGAQLLPVNPSWMFTSAAGFCGIASMIFMANYKNRAAGSSQIIHPENLEFFRKWRFLISDRRLMFFAVAGLVCSIAMRQFPSYVSQYLIALGQKEIEGIVSTLILTNTGLIVLFQLFVTRRVSAYSVKRNLGAGLLLLGLGLLGFMFSVTAYSWVAAMILFTAGEILIIPAEFSLIDRIAPAEHRGSYFSVQNLTVFGGALSPILCGFVLSESRPGVMFMMLMSCVLLSGLCYYLGFAAWGEASEVATTPD